MYTSPKSGYELPGSAVTQSSPCFGRAVAGCCRLGVRGGRPSTTWPSGHPMGSEPDDKIRTTELQVQGGGNVGTPSLQLHGWACRRASSPRWVRSLASLKCTM